MRPSATESLYKDLDIQEGAYEYSLPESYAIRPLRLSDLDQVVALEEKGFPEHERSTRDKIEYRLKVCPELCAGVFVRTFDWPRNGDVAKLEADLANMTEAEDEEEDEETGSKFGVTSKYSTLKEEKLVGHILSTKTSAKYVTDESMLIGGHEEAGSTIAIHSVVVDPEYQGRHIGYIMMKDYVQKFFGLCTAEGMALLAHDRLVPFYSKHGFKDEGASSSTFGNADWRALRLPFDSYDDQLDI